jgi:hypothetical protein
MSQFEIKLLKQGKEGLHVLSASFFTMKDRYRDFEKYKRHLKNFLRQSRLLPTFVVRIYTDDSGKDIALEAAESYDHVTVLHYDYPKFREGDGHIGTLGTIPRFLPLFEKGLEMVYVSDIDIPDSYLDVNIIAKMKKEGSKFLLPTRVCYQQRKPYGRKYTILAGQLIAKHIFSRAILTNFLKKLEDGGLDDALAKMNASNTRKPPSKIPYGIDEWFLNTVYYDSIRRLNVPVLAQVQYDFTGLIRDLTPQEDAILLTQYRNPTEETTRKAMDVFRKKIPALLGKYPCLQEVLDKQHLFKKDFILTFTVPSSEI